MNSLREQMLSLGLASKESVEKIEAKKRQKEEKKFQKMVSPPAMSIAQWKNKARKMLIAEPTLQTLRQIIKETHDLFKETKNFRRFLYPLYNLRDKLEEIPKERRKQLIKKLLW